MAQRQQRLLPTHYFHPVFTLPAELRPLAWRHKAVVFDLLFAAAAHTLIDLCRDPTHLGAEIGLSLVLHTWTRALTFHPHVHGILPGGGLDPAADRWVACDKEFLIHVDVLSPVFRGKFLDGLKQAYAHGAFTADTTLDPTRFQTLLDRLYQRHWNVYVKPPFAGPPAIVKYLGRYTHRTGIANSRLVSVTHDAVTFRTKNGNTCTLPPHEFIRRFLLHVLPHGYTKIRHYGLLAAGNVHTKLARARELIEQNQPPSPPAPPPSPLPADTAATEPQRDGTADDPAKPKLRCPNCQGTAFSLNQTETPRDSSRSCSSLAAPPRSSHAWQRKTSRASGRGACASTLRRTGVSARTSAGVYATDEPAGDQRGLALLPDPPPLLRPPPLLPGEE
jgi:hypothetical protein